MSHLFWIQSCWVVCFVCCFWQRFSRNKCLRLPLNILQLGFTLLGLKQSLGSFSFLLLNFLEIQNSE